MLNVKYCIWLIVVTITINNCIPTTYYNNNKQFNFIVRDSVLNFRNTDTTYRYQFSLPANGYYELKTRFQSVIADSVLDSDTSRFSKTIFYDNDTLAVQATILLGDSIIFTNIQKSYCVLNGGNLVFRYNTFRDKIPIKTELTLRVNVIRIGCNFPYNDVQFKLYMIRANTLI